MDHKLPKKELMPTVGLGFVVMILVTISFEISSPVFGNEPSYIIATVVEELLKIGLFVLFRKRAFYAILFFALIEVALVKLPEFCFINLDCFLFGIVFAMLGFIFHFSTAFLYDRVFSNKPNLVYFYATLFAAVAIHIFYNTIHLIVHSWPVGAVLALACSVVVFGIKKMYDRFDKAI